MTLLSDLFEIRINEKQLKLLYNKHILENEEYSDEEIYLEEEYFEYKETLLQNIDNIQIHSIISCSFKIRKQFLFIASPIDKNLSRIGFSFFKKHYNSYEKQFSSDLGICKKSFVIDIFAITPDKFNWLINEKQNKLDINNIKHIYEYNIKHEDFLLYETLYNNYTHLKNFEFKNWGPILGIYDISWNTSLDNIIKEEYGIDIYEKNYDYIQYYYFNQYILEDIYYKNTDKNSFIYKLIKEHSFFICDYCNNSLGNLNNNNSIWHSPIYGDICNSCYEYKLNLSKERINNKKKEILYIGKRITFQRDLSITKSHLTSIKFSYSQDLDKVNNTILSKIVKQLIKNSKRCNCGICLDVLDCNLVGGDCGHCFHANCIKMNLTDSCPLCRKKTNFVKLHLE